jgi:outer membrane protein
MSKKLLTATITAMVLVPGYSRAETITLNLEQCVERANNQDPRIAEKRELVGVARGMLQEAQGSKSWIYDVNAFAALSPRVKGGIFQDNKGNTVIRSDALDFDGISPWYDLEFAILHPLYTYGKVENYTHAAQNNIKIAQQEITLQRANTYIDVARAYNGYLAAHDARKLLEDADNKAEAALGIIKKWLENGEGNAKQSDLFALETGTALIKRAIFEAQGLERVAYDALKMLTGLNKDDELMLADKRIVPVDLPEQTLEQLQQLALQQRPEMAQVEAGLTARRALVAAKQSEKYPNVYAGVVGSVAISPLRENLDDVAVYDPFNHAGLTPIVGVKWDLFSGQQEGRITQAQAQYNALIEKKSFAQMGIPFQVAEQYHQMHATHDMIKKLYNAARSGRRWLISMYADFEAGLETSSNLVTAFQGYVVAYTDYFRAVNDYNLAVARLKVATGDIK